MHYRQEWDNYSKHMSCRLLFAGTAQRFQQALGFRRQKSARAGAKP
jgi:hypothetical protein